ncbi:MAG TPA: hypothetical protein VN634_06375 [Candidatus Limnocylindrales bacterium]|nr:hypothetical protein [Candidatus Limnocylindrales bacterium]
MTRLLHCLFAAALCIAVAARSSDAAGPLIVNGGGQPLTWPGGTASYNPDRGSLGALSNASATARLAAAADAWNDVATADVSLSAGSQLSMDVTSANYTGILSSCDDGLSPIVFDTDGKITDDLFGDGASEHIIGFAAPACGTYVPPELTEGYSVMNGVFLDGVDSDSNPELTPEQFDAVLIHELGHYLNLDHSQVGLSVAFDGDPLNDAAVATMFPILVNGTAMTSLHLDDMASVSSLYPAASFDTENGTIAGSVLFADGVTLFQGANVVARAVGDSLVTAVSQVSGAYYFPSNPGGPADAALRGRYELKGLPPGSYTVEIEPVYAAFIGGSSVGPSETPTGLPGAPEFWNGSDEAASNPPDDPAVAQAIVVTAGSVIDDIDFIANQGPIPVNDECSGAIDIDEMPFADAIDVTGATLGAFDPIQTCTEFFSQNYNSVWYQFTPSVDGVIHAATSGSNYDTIVSALSGQCGILTQEACDNDSGPNVTSDLVVAADAGVPYLFDVAARVQGGGLMEIAFDFAPAAACPPAPRNDCSAPSSVGHSSLRLRRGDPSNFALQWKWGPGDASAAELGDPSTDAGTSYALCVYDAANSLRLMARAPAGTRCGSGLEGCWSVKSSGLSYKDAGLLPDGLGSAKLKADDAGRAKFKLKGAGDALGMPVLPLVFPLSVQWMNSDGHCWSSAFPSNGMLRNDTDELRARG